MTALTVGQSVCIGSPGGEIGIIVAINYETGFCRTVSGMGYNNILNNAKITKGLFPYMTWQEAKLQAIGEYLEDTKNQQIKCNLCGEKVFPPDIYHDCRKQEAKE